MNWIILFLALGNNNSPSSLLLTLLYMKKFFLLDNYGNILQTTQAYEAPAWFVSKEEVDPVEISNYNYFNKMFLS